MEKTAKRSASFLLKASSLPQKFKFVDQAKIFIEAGDGGNGNVGFRREKFVPRGGPDGGDGGKGGDITVVGSIHLGTLQDFQLKRHFRAGNGQKGGSKQKTGADGSSLQIKVPLGTIIYDEKNKTKLGEIVADGETLLLADGGKGGLGNIHFKTSTNQAPRKATPGEKREGQWVRLELKLIADVGIVGFPNAGKSTLLARLTAAKPKIGDYPFTTLSPSLGVLERDGKRLTLADIPGLIEGAHEGHGLGFHFLRHIQRTGTLLYVISVETNNAEKIWNQYKATRDEISAYDKKILERPFIVALNKIDLLTDVDLRRSMTPFEKESIHPVAISAKEGGGIDALAKRLYEGT